MYINNYILVIIIIVILYIYYLVSKSTTTDNKLNLKKVNEVVENLDDITGRYCETCDNLSFGQCIKCFNCRFKPEDKPYSYKGKCVNGDITSQDTIEYGKKWITNDTFWRNNNSNNKCALSAFMN